MAVYDEINEIIMCLNYFGPLSTFEIMQKLAMRDINIEYGALKKQVFAMVEKKLIKKAKGDWHKDIEKFKLPD